MKNIICIISGPTASGKTSTGIRLAKDFGGEIVNFDSLLFYNELSIGTAKPNEDELKLVPHHMINIRSLNTPLNAADYIKEAVPLINKLHREDKIVYLVGGSGFYLQALLNGMFESETTPLEIQKKSDELYENKGIEPFLEILKSNDPLSFTQYHENDHYRIRRAVEHFWTTSSPFSESRKNMDDIKKLGPAQKYNWNIFHIYLDLPKIDHFKIIQERTKNMLEAGLINEVEQLLKQGFSGQEKPLKSIGYKESIQFLNRDIKDLDQLKDKIEIKTRQLAKAQRTWFKKIEKNQYNPVTEFEKLYNDYKSFLDINR